MIDLPQDFIDVLTELADAEAEFVVVGGHAVGFHGHSRATKDIDILVRPTKENAVRVFHALRAFGAPLASLEVTEDDLASYFGVVQIGLPPNRIDILTQISGVTFDEASAGDSQFELDGRAIKVIGLDALVKNKRSTGRGQDVVDADALERNKRQ